MVRRGLTFVWEGEQRAVERGELVRLFWLGKLPLFKPKNRRGGPRIEVMGLLFALMEVGVAPRAAWMGARVCPELRAGGRWALPRPAQGALPLENPDLLLRWGRENTFCHRRRNPAVGLMPPDFALRTSFHRKRNAGLLAHELRAGSPSLNRGSRRERALPARRAPRCRAFHPSQRG